MQKFPRKPVEHEQLDLFRPMTNRPQWKNLPAKVRHQVASMLAQLIAEFVSDQTHSKDQKELIDE
ncbi:hypothetical protein [Novipirellula artificiosorum]|uniref:Uncharacterized protein n=1 Tax=Novipirellula artificiosorum TaxID=2528016 RepID=A0A5C6DR49_9BACT|nr:hypothetical protein [Novipirellula artificiosorum]TWU39753.1 hypothetical protein Poly41_26090 [Novipirellula artificiosorum]